MDEKTYSTLQAAKKAGVHRATLIRWLQEGKVDTDIKVPLAGGNILRRWSDADMQKLKAYKEDNYWAMPEGKGRKR
jgi:transposase